MYRYDEFDHALVRERVEEFWGDDDYSLGGGDDVMALTLDAQLHAQPFTDELQDALGKSRDHGRVRGVA